MRLGIKRYNFDKEEFWSLEDKCDCLLRVIKSNENKPITKKELGSHLVVRYENGKTNVDDLEWKKETIHHIENYKKDQLFLYLSKEELTSAKYKINGQTSNEEVINKYTYTELVNTCDHVYQRRTYAKEDVQLEYDTIEEVLTDKNQIYDIFEDIKTMYQAKINEQLEHFKEVTKELENLKNGK